MNRTPLALFLISLFFVPACQAGGSEAAKKEAASPAAAAAGTAGASPQTVIARVNGKEIPSRQLEQSLKLYMERSGRDPKSVPASQIKQLRKHLLDNLVSSELLYQASEAAKISVTDHDVDQRLQALQGKFPSDQEFTAYLQAQGITVEEMKSRIRRNLMTEQLVKREVDSKISVPDSEISDYYSKNKDRLRRPEVVKLSEIFVRAGSKASADAKAKARQKIQALLKEVQNGKDFASLARQFSESPDAKDGGDMGYITQSGTLPVLSQAAFKLNVGEVSDVVQSPFGYHLLKVTEKRPAGDVTLKEAKPRISDILFQQKEKEALNAYLDKLKAKAKIEILGPTP